MLDYVVSEARRLEGIFNLNLRTETETRNDYFASK
jgi:hypothetical protein